MAEATGQDLYNLCLCLERFPGAYEAFRNRVIRRALSAEPKSESFQERRERTRMQRIQRYAR